MLIADDFYQLAVLPVESGSTNFAEVGTGPGGNAYFESDNSSDSPIVKRFYWED